MASVGVNTYARVRCFFKDRESLRRAVTTKTAKETSGKGVLTTLASEEESVRAMTTQFTDCLGETSNNGQAYEVICIPLLEKVLLGFKAILIAYGQTGSGKTFSLIGAKGEGQLGLLPRSIETLLGHERVLKLQIKAFEAYATSLKKIPLFDLFGDVNRFKFDPFVEPSDDRAKNKAAEYKWVQKKSAAAQALWNTKKGRTGVDAMNEGLIHDIDTVEDGFRLVEEAHDASHFAKTGKNPESSRGHTVYVILVQMTNPQGADYQNLKTEFVVVDLAGSEGGSTLDALPDGAEKTCRFLEGGVINYGLTSLKDMFGEMRKKGKLKKTQGVGLRKLLYPFMTTNTMMSIVFTLSPSWDNVRPTRATMKFAQDACKLKMKPIAASGGKNYQKLYEKMKTTFDEKLELIEKLQATIDQGIEHMETGSGGGSGGGHMAEVLGTIYQEKQDKVYQMYKDYGLTDYLDHAVLEDVEGSIENKKTEYFGLMKAVLKKKAPGKIDDINDMLDDYMTRGIGFHAGYEFICEQYGTKAKKDKYAERESRGISMAQSQGGDSGAWAENAKRLQSQAASQVENAKAGIADLEDQVLNADEEEEVEGVNMAMEYADDVHDDIVFEEIDVGGPPDFYKAFSNEQQNELTDLFADVKNVENGKMKYKFIKLVMNSFDLSKAQVTDLHQFMLIQQGQNNVLSAVKDFSAEMGGENAMEHMENMDVLLDLKQQIHQLENEKRVEKSLKLWGQMRLKIRDRKLKTREQQVAALEQKLGAKTEELDNVNTGMMASIKDKLDGFQGGSGGGAVEQKLDQILTAAGAGGFGGAAAGPDEKVEAELNQAKQQIMVLEEQVQSLDEIKAAIDNDDTQRLVANLGSAQQKLSEEKFANVRCQGQMQALRNYLGTQSRTIDRLTAQIFIILQFPKMISVSGREGFNDKMNGDYVIGSHLHSGRVFYKHQDNSWVIRWYEKKGLWIMDHRGLNDDDEGSACTDADVGHPLMVRKQWIVFGGQGQGFRVDPNIMISGDVNIKRGPR